MNPDEFAVQVSDTLAQMARTIQTLHERVRELELEREYRERFETKGRGRGDG